MSLPDDDAIVLLHNPSCSKSRRAKELLDAAGVAYTERAYLERPLDRAELEDLRARLARPAAEWVREREARAAGVDPAGDEATLLAALAAHPELLERPIVVRGPRAVVGRPPEDVLALLG